MDVDAANLWIAASMVDTWPAIGRRRDLDSSEAEDSGAYVS